MNQEPLKWEIDWEKLGEEHEGYMNIPYLIKKGLESYVKEKRPVGSFLTAVLSNDLRGAVCQADSKSLACLKDIVLLIYNHFPSKCWGSPEKVRLWLG